MIKQVLKPIFSSVKVFVFAYNQVMDFDRKLDRPINDLDDIRIIMETQKKIRDQEIDMDMKIDLVSKIDVLLHDCQNSKIEIYSIFFFSLCYLLSSVCLLAVFYFILIML